MVARVSRARNLRESCSRHGCLYSCTPVADRAAQPAAHSSSAANGVALSAQVVGQIFFHLNGMFVRHRVQMLEQLWQQSNTISPDQPGRFVPVFNDFQIDSRPAILSFQRKLAVWMDRDRGCAARSTDPSAPLGKVERRKRYGGIRVQLIRVVGAYAA